MNNKNFTSILASLKASSADIRKLNTKLLTAEKINLNGKDLESQLGFKKPEDFKKLFARMGLDSSDNYILYTDCGAPVYMSFAHKLINGNHFFKDNSNIAFFMQDLPLLRSGDYMFRGCENLTTFISDLSSLENGNYMFYGCRLDAESVESILKTIPEYTDGASHILTMGIQAGDAVAKFNEITGEDIVSGNSISYKGWTIKITIAND